MTYLQSFKNFVDSLTVLGQTFQDNFWFSVACSIVGIVVFVVILAFLISRVFNIKHKFRDRIKLKINSVLYGAESESEISFEPIWNNAKEYHKNADCPRCIHPLGSFFGTLHGSLFTGTFQMILTAVYEFDYRAKISEADYTDYLHNLAVLIKNKSQYRMKLTSKGLGRLIESTNNERFSDTDSIAKLKEIMDEARKLKKKENAEIWKTIFFPWKWRH